jgi:hypothetical protein
MSVRTAKLEHKIKDHLDLTGRPASPGGGEDQVATPANTKQALQMVFDGLGYLAAADPAALAAQAQAECLQAFAPGITR